jgi:hypothetical protein
MWINVAKYRLTSKEFLGYFGFPMNAEEMVYLGFRAPVPLKRELEQLAAEKDLTITQVVRQAVREYIARQRPAGKKV